MKHLFRALLLALGLAACLGTSEPSFAQEQEMPLEKSSTGTTSIEYGGQHFRVTATAKVKIRFEMVSTTEIKLTFVSETGQPGTVAIYWVEFSKHIYNGPIPTSEPWEGDLNTEGGFIDR